jgi:cell division protein FtsW (lipid II flippase)
MFSNGQLVFASLFIVFFGILVVYSYKKDNKLHLKNYQGVKWVGISFMIFLVILFCIKYLLKN